MPREDRRVLNIKQDSINEIDYYPSSQTVADGDMVISHPKGKTLRLYKKLKGMLWWNDFTKDGNQIIEKNLEVKGKINDISMGTSALPDGGIGFAKFAMSGTTTNANGPHIQYTTSADSYPVFQQLNWGHDNVSLNFDCYYDGTWRSGDAGSNFQFYKIGDIFKLMYDSGIAQGSAVTWNNGITLNTSGQVGIGTASPDDALHVKGNIFIEDASPEITFETGAGKYNWQIAAQENTDQAFEIGLGSNDVDASNDTFSPLMTFQSTGRVGIGTTAPGQPLDINSGDGNMIADGYDTHSLAIYKENIEDASGYLNKVISCPAQQWNRKPFISANKIKEAALDEFGEDVWNGYFPEENSHKNKALYNMPESDLKTWIDNWCEAKRVEMRPENKWQKKRLGLVADAELTAEHLPEVIAINDTGEPTGIDTMTYIGILHNAIQELSAKVEALENA